MSNSKKSQVRYSLSFQQKVVREMEEHGEMLSTLRNRYGIKGGETIQNWLRKFGKNHLLNKIVRIETMEEKDQIKEMKDEIHRLKLALADSLMAQKCLETVIEEASKEYNTDLKKSFGEHPSNGSAKTTR